MAAATTPLVPGLDAQPPSNAALPRLWVPRRLLITKAARQHKYALEIAERAAALGSTIVELNADRLPPISADGNRNAYAEAKNTLALVVAPPSALKLQPIPPSADWQFHLAQGCPAHCQYCYLAGSLQGPPITRAFVNLDQILQNLHRYLGQGTITSRSTGRQEEGTTFECSCYTDPLALEHLTGGLARAITFFGAWNEPVQLRWTTKFDNVESLLALQHAKRTRIRFSVNALPVTRSFEGGTASLAARLAAMRKVALAGFPVGLTVAPIMDIPDFEASYAALFRSVAAVLEGISGLDLTAELITHRFTPGSKEVLLNWYPKTPLDLKEESRTQKRTKFGTFKYVYPNVRMKQMRETVEGLIQKELPAMKILYWT